MFAATPKYRGGTGARCVRADDCNGNWRFGLHRPCSNHAVKSRRRTISRRSCGREATVPRRLQGGVPTSGSPLHRPSACVAPEQR